MRVKPDMGLKKKMEERKLRRLAVRVMNREKDTQGESLEKTISRILYHL